jgi:hypothetical protein
MALTSFRYQRMPLGLVLPDLSGRRHGWPPEVFTCSGSMIGSKRKARSRLLPGRAGLGVMATLVLSPSAAAGCRTPRHVAWQLM